MKTGLSRPLFQKCSAGTSIHSEFTTSGPDLRTSKGWALLCLLWLAEKSPCPENLETWDLGLLSQQKLGPLLVFLWRVLQLPEEKRIMVKPFHRSSSQAWLKESSVKFMGKKQWTKAKQSAHVVVLPLLHRSLGTYSVGDCALISEGEIMEKGDRSLGGEEIKETHLPWYRKKIFIRTKTYCKRQVFSSRSFTKRLQSSPWLLWRPHSCQEQQFFCEKLFAELELGSQTLRQLDTNNCV